MVFVLLRQSGVKLQPKARSSAAFALMEGMISAGIVGIVASSTLFAMMGSNRFVVSQRYTSNAMALCQERVDQALIEPFTSTTRPVFFGAGALPATEPENPTHTESVPIYTVSASGAPTLVTGTRNTWVTGYAPEVSDPGFVYARVRVRVEFWANGRGLQNRRQGTASATPHFCEMTTLRASDSGDVAVSDPGAADD